MGLIYWLKSLAIVEFLVWLLRNCWTFLVIFLFWDDINSFMSQFELWRLCMERIQDVAYSFMGTELYYWLYWNIIGLGQSISAFLQPAVDTIKELFGVSVEGA